jgi:hypothetical protein
MYSTQRVEKKLQPTVTFVTDKLLANFAVLIERFAVLKSAQRWICLYPLSVLAIRVLS